MEARKNDGKVYPPNTTIKDWNSSQPPSSLSGQVVSDTRVHAYSIDIFGLARFT